MSVKLFQECMIIPFAYDRSYFDRLENEPLFGDFFVRKEFNSAAYNVRGRMLLTEEGRENKEYVLQRYLLSGPGRRACGLHQSKKYSYPVKKRNGSLQLGDIEVWFFKSGSGFLTIKVKSSFENTDAALDFHADLPWTAFYWTEKKRRDDVLTERTQEIKIRRLAEQCLEILRDAGAGKAEEGRTGTERSWIERSGVDFKYNLAFFLTDEEHETASEAALRKLCMQEKAGRGNANLDSECDFYEYCGYIRWAVSKSAAAVWADEYTAGESNQSFIATGFPASVFSNYLALYLYYLEKKTGCEKMEQLAARVDSSGESLQLDSEEAYGFLKLDREFLPLAEGKYAQLDILLRKTLGEGQWRLSERLTKLREQDFPRILKKKKTDVFISYRHDGGQYLALLIVKELRKKGVSVFWDKTSMRAGAFEEQIYKVLDECRNVIVIISENCISRLQEENDWVRKELAYALKTEERDGKQSFKSKVLMVPMEGVRLPTEADRNELPEDVRKLVDCHGTDEARVGLFDSLIERILDAIA